MTPTAYPNVSKGSKPQPGLYKKVQAWVAEVQRYMEVFETSSYPATATLIHTLYMHDQKVDEEHHTFNRYFKQVTWNPNMQVVRLMGLAATDSGIGSELAERIIGKFGTVWNFLHADPVEFTGVPRLGVDRPVKLLQKIGRPDV